MLINVTNAPIDELIYRTKIVKVVKPMQIFCENENFCQNEANIELN